MASGIYLGQVMHKRMGDIEYQFRYGVMSLRIDLDSIADEARALRWLSLNRFNLYSLYAKDYGARDGRPWRAWIDAILADYGLPARADRVELVCFPRFLGIVFNPLAMWYAYDAEDRLVGIIGEVSNTFGQWHHYVLTDAGRALDDRVGAETEKAFHVSPFIGMDCRYAFRFSRPGERYQIAIQQSEHGRPRLVATQVGRAVALSDRNLLRAAATHPFNTLKVLTMIHWWALRIWLKGGRFHPTPKALEGVRYSHSEMKLC